MRTFKSIKFKYITRSESETKRSKKINMIVESLDYVKYRKQMTEIALLKVQGEKR